LLPTKEQIADWEKMTGNKWEPRRRSGRSTGMALRYLGRAFANRPSWEQILDHSNSCEADRHLARMIEDIVTKLELQHIEFKREGQKFFVRFNWPVQ
jgi:hypothetical protein